MMLFFFLQDPLEQLLRYFIVFSLGKLIIFLIQFDRSDFLLAVIFQHGGDGTVKRDPRRQGRWFSS